jgi:hypothetical protein
MNKSNALVYISCLGILKYSSDYFNRKIENVQPVQNHNLTYNDICEIFQIHDTIFKNQYKNILHLSTPYNRKIKYIYNLPFFYTEYENYNFNKLSDFFLNIHIFIN